MKRAPLTSDAQKRREFQQRAQRNSKPKRRAVSPASPAQRAKVKDCPCIVCLQQPVHPAHVIDRSLLVEGQDDPRAVVALCAYHHREYDEGRHDLLPDLEVFFREELAFAVERFGLLSTLERVTNVRWVPDPHQPGFEQAA